MYIVFGLTEDNYGKQYKYGTYEKMMIFTKKVHGHRPPIPCDSLSDLVVRRPGFSLITSKEHLFFTDYNCCSYHLLYISWKT